MAEQLWRVIGGGDKGGIVARMGCGLSSPALDERLSTGATVRQLELFQGRLYFELVKGKGPAEGWVSLKFKDTDLLVKSDGSDPPLEAAPKPAVKAAAVDADAAAASDTTLKSATADGGGAFLGKLPVRPTPIERNGTIELKEFVVKLSALEEVLKSADNSRMEEALGELSRACITAPKDLAWKFACMWGRWIVVLLADIRLGKSGVTPKNFVTTNHVHQATLGADHNPMSVVQPSTTFTGEVFWILGWGGSQLSDLTDVCGFYSNKYPGSLVASTIAAGGDPLALAVIGEVIELAVNSWADNPGVTPSLVIHLFSNMGSMAWNTILPMWADQVASPDEGRLRGKVPPMDKILRAIIFDSSPDEMIPFEPSMNSITNGCAALYSTLVGINPDGTEMDKTAITKANMEAKMEFMNPESSPRLFYDSNREELFKMTRPNLAYQRKLEPPVQMLFIYSTVDKIIPYQGVEKYFGECESKLSKAGLPAPRRLKFEDRQSAHCFHKKVHTKEYWDAVSSLLDDVF